LVLVFENKNVEILLLLLSATGISLLSVYSYEIHDYYSLVFVPAFIFFVTATLKNNYQ